MRCSFQINPYKSYSVIDDSLSDWEETVSLIKDIKNNIISTKKYPVLELSKRERKIVAGLLIAFQESVKMCGIAAKGLHFSAH